MKTQRNITLANKPSDQDRKRWVTLVDAASFLEKTLNAGDSGLEAAITGLKEILSDFTANLRSMNKKQRDPLREDVEGYAVGQLVYWLHQVLLREHERQKNEQLLSKQALKRVEDLKSGGPWWYELLRPGQILALHQLDDEIEEDEFGTVP